MTARYRPGASLFTGECSNLSQPLFLFFKAIGAPVG